jgi:hypothetical protein
MPEKIRLNQVFIQALASLFADHPKNCDPSFSLRKARVESSENTD